MATNLSDHFTLEELILSQTAAREGIDNTPSPVIVHNLCRLVEVLEEVRSLLGGVPMLVSSGYRSPALNQAVKGANKSAHMDGLAADFTAPRFGTVIQVANKIADSQIVYDQLIHEYGSWVHIALAATDVTPRRENLSIFRGTGYLRGIRDRA
ncbi:MAG TPA: D-Ala-D-Ala carboxypeptidase family metallohydrolase [Acidobacteriota bacterium]|nr:D-Ala-D-Ala carboxypeptidase family metallohydrolase [Acidobacteriota bacterium]